MAATRTLISSLEWERRLWDGGIRDVAGTDEVGRGPLAGPVVAGAVILPADCRAEWVGELRDSKQLSERQRDRLADCIWAEAKAVGIGVVPSMLIDSIGIAAAGRLAMKQAISRLTVAPSYLLIDAFALPDIHLPQESIVHGDAIVASISAASIVAKVERDRLMREMHELYQGYWFDRNKGYGTAAHLCALRRLGPSPIHRRSFAPVATAHAEANRSIRDKAAADVR